MASEVQSAPWEWTTAAKRAAASWGVESFIVDVKVCLLVSG